MVVPFITIALFAIYKIKAGLEMALPSIDLGFLALLRSSRRNKPL